MTKRRSPLPVVALGMCAAAFGIVLGCGSRENSPGGKPGALPTAAIPSGSSTPVKEGKLVADWPKPDGALLISGQQIGFLEPCGCTEGQRGGLARRLDLVQKLRKQGWPIVALDLGDLINDPFKHGGPQETKIRFTYALKGLEAINYAGLALGPADMKLGVQEVVAQILNLGDGLKIVCANVRPNPDLGLDEKFVPSLRLDSGPFKVGVTAVYDDAALKKLKDPDLANMLRTSDIADALPEIVADLKKDTDFRVLLVQGEPEAARRLAKAYPDFDIVVATSEVVDPPKDAETVNGGRTKIVSVGQKGQYVGLVGIYKNAADAGEKAPASASDKHVPSRYRRIELNARYDKKTEPIRTMIDVEFQDELRRAGVLESYTRRTYAYNDAPSDAAYVGAETCKACHPGAYNKWVNSKHAKAYDALVKGPRGNHEADADCVRCHTTGFEYKGGFVTAALTPNLKGNQCENCHGPGSKHSEKPDDATFRKAIARKAEEFDKGLRCVACHSEDDSPKFNFAQYYPKIMHKGLDRYDDPKVHQGISAPRVAVQSDK